MGHVKIQSHDSLSAEQVFTVFQTGLAGRYDVRRSSLPAVDFIVRKSALVGVGVKLQSKKGEARLRCAPMIPSTFLRMLLLNGLVSSIFMWPVLKRTLKDVESFAETAPGLTGGEAPSAQPSAAASSKPAAASSKPTVASSKPTAGPRPLFTALWIGLTALFLPSVVGMAFGYPPFFFARPFVVQALLTGAIAYVLPRFVQSPLLARPIVLGGVAWMASSLVLGAFGFGVGNEISTWFSRYGLAEFAVLGLSLLVLGRLTRGGAGGAAPAAAAS